jgi:hypothetical protein
MTGVFTQLPDPLARSASSAGDYASQCRAEPQASPILQREEGPALTNAMRPMVHAGGC